MKAALLILMTILFVTPVFADDDASAREREREFFTFGDGGEDKKAPQNCQAPSKPEFIKKLSLEERLIIATIYRNMVAQPIIENQYCTCDLLYPKFDKALEIFTRDFVPLGLPTNPRSKAGEFTRKFINDEPFSYSKAAHICLSQGVR
jgi:hypothetical protein